MSVCGSRPLALYANANKLCQKNKILNGTGKVYLLCLPFWRIFCRLSTEGGVGFKASKWKISGRGVLLEIPVTACKSSLRPCALNDSEDIRFSNDSFVSNWFTKRSESSSFFKVLQSRLSLFDCFVLQCFTLLFYSLFVYIPVKMHRNVHQMNHIPKKVNGYFMWNNLHKKLSTF